MIERVTYERLFQFVAYISKAAEHALNRARVDLPTAIHIDAEPEAVRIDFDVAQTFVRLTPDQAAAMGVQLIEAARRQAQRAKHTPAIFPYLAASWINELLRRAQANGEL